MIKPVLGVDVGGVIIGGRTDTQDTIFSQSYLKTPGVEDAFESLRELGEYFDIHLVSKCGLNVQQRTLHWLDYKEFSHITGIPKDKMHFCPTRQGKAPICEKINAKFFVDDRIEVLQYLNLSHSVLFNPSPKEVRRRGFRIADEGGDDSINTCWIFATPDHKQEMMVELAYNWKRTKEILMFYVENKTTT